METTTIETYLQIVEKLIVQKKTLDRIEGLVEQINLATLENREMITKYLGNINSDIIEKLKNILYQYKLEMDACADAIAVKIQKAQDCDDKTFIAITKEINNISHHIYLIYGLVSLIIVQLVTIIIKIWF
jgi:hypothetical protein